MPVLPLLRPREVVGAFERLGWRAAILSIPDHAQVARGTLRVLIAKAGLTIGELLAAAR
jgi:hypothetical protein